MNTVRELRKYCKEHDIKGYSRLKKVRLIDDIGPFAFSDEIFSEGRKERETKIRCDDCGRYYKMSEAKEHTNAFHKNEFDDMQTLKHMTIKQLRDLCRLRGLPVILNYEGSWSLSTPHK